MTSHNSNINMETKTNTVNEMTTTYSKSYEFILGLSYKILNIYIKKKHRKNLQLLLVINIQCHTNHN